MQIYIVYKETWLIDGPGVHDMHPFLDESIARHHFIAEKEKLEKNGWVLEKELGNINSFVFMDSSCTTEDNGAFLGLYMKKLELKGEKVMDTRNIQIVQKLHNILNMIKGFDSAYGNPSKGTMLVRHNGITYRIDISPIYVDESYEKDKAFDQVCKENQYIWK